MNSVYFVYLMLITRLLDLVKRAQAEFKGPDSGSVKMQWVVTNFGLFVEGIAAAGVLSAKLSAAITDATPKLVEVIVQLFKAVHGAVPEPAPTPVPVPVWPSPAPEPTPAPSVDPTTVEYDIAEAAIRACTQVYPRVYRKANGKFVIWSNLDYPGATQIYPTP